MVHWADILAGELLERGERHVLATGITPSGPIHVGNMREVLTTEAVHRAVQDAGGDSTLIYIGDSYDPLRKVYPFLEDHDTDYSEHVGRPLAHIPSPSGTHDSYAHEFLDPFLTALDELGIEPEVRLAHEMYEGGAYTEGIVQAMENTSRIRDILEGVSGRQLPKNWIPFNVRCTECDRIMGTKALLYEFPEVEYECECGHAGRCDIRTPGAGKLPWRLDWPARWAFLGVTFEAFGKDHAASGGSWDTGQPIAREIFGVEPPHHTVYEFIHIKGKGAMHSSTGLAVSATEMLAMTPPEVLRFLLMRYDPRRHIDFDPGLGLLDLVDEYDKWLSAHLADETTTEMKEAERVLQLSQPRGDLPDHQPILVPFRHLVTVAQVAPDLDTAIDVLARGGFIEGEASDAERDALDVRLEHARNWIDTFAPDMVKFEVQDAVSKAAKEHAAADALGVMADTFGSIDWDAEHLHNAVYDAAEATGHSAGQVFQAAYLALLDKKRGPRFGHFAALLDRDLVIARFREAAGKE